MTLPGGVAVNSVQFELESWTGAQRAFAVKSFYKNSDSYFAAQCEFCEKFGIHQNSKVPSAHAIKTSVNNFEETGSTVKPSAWGHLNPSSYCDVRRLFYGVFKLWSKLQRKK